MPGIPFKNFVVNGSKKLSIVFAGFFDRLFPFVYKHHKKKFSKSIINEISGTTYIVSPLETLSVIGKMIKENEPGIYLRFGDGDVMLSAGKDDSFQKGGKELGKEMRECFALKGQGVIKSLIIHSERYGCEKEMYPGNHLVSDTAATELLEQVYPFFTGYRIYSPVALHYTASYYPEIANDFLKLLKKEAVLFIGNEDVPDPIVRRLFGEAKHVKTPARNSFDKIDRIEKEAEIELGNNKKPGTVILAMGCSGRMLGKRLFKKNPGLFFFDFGSLLDGICGNPARTWLQEVNINYEALLKEL